MGIKCSLLGHSFGDATVEREREEQGSEVVITIRETETCERCGEQRVVSENKEVTTLETPEDVGAEPTPDDDQSSVDDKTVPTVEEAEDSDDEFEDEPPVTDDAEILDDDEAEQPEREPGEWPQEADPDEDHEDEDFDQYGYVEDSPDEDPAEDDAEIVDDEPDTVSTAEDDDDAEFIDADGDSEPGAQAQTNAWPSESESEETAGQPTGPGAVTVPDGQFVCGNCGFSTPVESSSLRAGDFCPECHMETLEQVRE